MQRRLCKESVDEGWVRTNYIRQKTPNTTAKRECVYVRSKVSSIQQTI